MKIHKYNIFFSYVTKLYTILNKVIKLYEFTRITRLNKQDKIRMFRTIIVKLSFPVYRLRLFKKLIRKWMLKLENPCNLSDFLGY